MMQSAEDWDGSDVADPLNCSLQRCISLQRQVRARSVVIRCIGQQDTAQVTLATDQHLIQAFPAKRPDQTLSDAILPRRSRRYRTITDAHRCDPGRKDMSVGAIIVTYQVGRCRRPRERLGDLSGQPFGRRMPGHLNPQQLASAVPDDQKCKQPFKGHRRNDAQVDRRNFLGSDYAETSSNSAMAAADRASCISKRSIGRPQSPASTTRRGYVRHPTAGFPDSSAGPGPATHGQSWAALPASATSSANRLETPSDATAESYRALRFERHGKGQATTGPAQSKWRDQYQTDAAARAHVSVQR